MNYPQNVLCKGVSGGKVIGKMSFVFEIILFFALAILYFPALSTAASIDYKSVHEEEHSASHEKIEKLLDGGTFTGKYIYALRLLSDRQDEKAEEYFAALLSSDKNSLEARWGLAEIARRRYLFKESASELDEIIKLREDFVPAKISRAYLYFQEDQYRDAIALAENILKMGSENVDTGNIVRAHLIIGGAKGILAEQSFILTKVTRGLKVLSHLKKARKISPEDPEVLYAWGSYYLKAPGLAGGDINKAEEFLLEALDKSPALADVYARLAQLYFKKNDKESAETYIESGMAIDPRNKLLKEVIEEARKDE